MTTKIELEVFITPLSQFHIGTGFGMGRFIDKATIKNKLGAIYIPGSTIKGKAKYFGRQLAKCLGIECCAQDQPCKGNACIMCRSFGSPLHQGKFFFSDATLPDDIMNYITSESEANTAIPLRFLLNTRTGTKIDRRLGTVEEHHLFTTETGMGGISLTAQIYGIGNDFIFSGEGELPLELAFLLNSFKLISHLGGGKSQGFGRVKIEWGQIFMNGHETPFRDNLMEEVEALYDLYRNEC